MSKTEKKTQSGSRLVSMLTGLDGAWADDKEKFKIDLVNDIKTMLFGKWEKPWVPALSFTKTGKPLVGFYSINGRDYRNSVNTLMLRMNAGNSPYFCTINHVSKANGTITDKNKITWINGFVPLKAKGTGDGMVVTWDDPDFVLPKPYRVINTDFVDGIKVPTFKIMEFKKKELNNYVENLLNELKSLKRVPKLIYDQKDACFFQYSPDYSTDEIHLVDIDQFKKIENYYSTLFHEIIHSTKSTKRLGRKKIKGASTDIAYAKEELVAEMGASILCSELSLEYSRNNTIAYLKGWLKTAAKEDGVSYDDVLLETYGYAVDAVEYLLQDINLSNLTPKTMIDRMDMLVNTKKPNKVESKEITFALNGVAKNAKKVAQNAKKVADKAKKPVTKKSVSKKVEPKCNEVEPIKVEHFTEDVRLLRRFNACIGKERQRRTILTIYRDFERRITERKVNRTSKHADLVWQCSKKLAIVLEKMESAHLTHVKVDVDDNFKTMVANASNEVSIRTSVNLLKRFIGIEGAIKPDKAKVELIVKAFRSAYDSKKITKDDFYQSEIILALQSMKKYLDGKTDHITADPTTLSGFGLGKPKATATLNGSGVNGLVSDFNNAIKRFFSNASGKEDTYSLGKPKKILIDLGMPDKEIIIRKSTLETKRKRHGLTFAHLKNLPNQINAPLLVFKYEKGKETFNVFISKANNEGLLMCGVNAAKQRVNKIEVSEIITIHGRNCNQLLSWVQKGLLLYAADMDKIKKLLSDSGINRQQCEQLFKALEAKAHNKGTKEPRKSKLSGFENEPVIVNRFQVDLTPTPPEPEPMRAETVIQDKAKDDTSLNGLFTPITQSAPQSTQSKIQLPGDMGKFLGYVERYEYAILLRGEKGAGKTRMTYQMMNTFAKAGFTVGCFTLEIGKHSNLVTDMRNEYLCPTIASNVQVAEACPNGLEDIKAAARVFDVVCIDSWGKIPNTKAQDFDNLRKEFAKTMFIVIFQSTTNGTARGGSMPEYDAGVVIQVAEGGRAYCEKNRYSGEDLTYMVFDRKLENKEVVV